MPQVRIWKNIINYVVCSVIDEAFLTRKFSLDYWELCRKKCTDTSFIFHEFFVAKHLQLFLKEGL